MSRQFLHASSGDRSLNRVSRRASRLRPTLESLERRLALSFIGSEKHISASVLGYAQYDADNASSANGTSVAVWTREYSATDHDIFAQRFDSSGQPVGPLILVDNSGARDSFDPDVAMAPNGSFVVVWRDKEYNDDLGDDASELWMQRYNASGNPIGSQVHVATAGYYYSDFTPEVAMNNTSIVVAFEDFGGTDADIPIVARRYTINATSITSSATIPVAYYGYDVQVAMNTAGAFQIAYTTDDGELADLLVNRYNSSGAALGISTIASTFDFFDYKPSVAMDRAGNSVVAYEVEGTILARRISTAGVVGAQIKIRNRTNALSYSTPSVAIAPVGGLFVVAWNRSDGKLGVSEVSSSNTILAHLGPVAGIQARISIDGFNRYLVTYGRGTGISRGIYSRRDLLT